MDQVSIVDLPFELYQHLFEYLEIPDLIELRQVCKRLHYFISSEFELKELIFGNKLVNRRVWHSTSRHYEFRKRTLKPSWFRVFRAFNLKYLKRLQIEVKEGSSELHYVNYVNELKLLEHLEINFLEPDHKETKRSYFKLPNLKVLALANDGLSELPLCEFDTPNLKILSFDLSSFPTGIDFVQPCSMRQLTMNHFDDRASMFEKIEIFHLIESKLEDKLEPSILSTFSELKTLKLPLLKENKESIVNFVDEKKRLRRDDLEIYYHGILVSGRGYEIKQNDLIDLHREIVKEVDLDRQYMPVLKHFERADFRLVHFNTLRYTEFVESTYLANGAVFFKKLNNLKCIIVESEIKNPGHFLRFLTSCRGLNELKLQNCGLNQNFFNNLPIFLDLARLLIISDQKLDLDFSFLLNMKSLESFSTNQELTLDDEELEKLLKMESIRELKFLTNNLDISIMQTDRRGHTIEAFNSDFFVTRKLFKKLNVKNLQNWYDEVRKIEQEMRLRFEDDEQTAQQPANCLIS